MIKIYKDGKVLISVSSIIAITNVSAAVEMDGAQDAFDIRTVSALDGIIRVYGDDAVAAGGKTYRLLKLHDDLVAMLMKGIFCKYIVIDNLSLVAGSDPITELYAEYVPLAKKWLQKMSGDEDEIFGGREDGPLETEPLAGPSVSAMRYWQTEKGDAPATDPLVPEGPEQEKIIT